MNLLIQMSEVVLLIIFTYILIRFGSAAFYRSKKEFLEWYHNEENTNRRKEE